MTLLPNQDHRNGKTSGKNISGQSSGFIFWVMIPITIIFVVSGGTAYLMLRTFTSSNFSGKVQLDITTEKGMSLTIDSQGNVLEAEKDEKPSCLQPEN